MRCLLVQQYVPSHMLSVAVVTQARQLAMTDDGHLLFHPSGSVIQTFRVEDGKPFKVLRGHMETVNSCAWNPDMQVRSPTAVTGTIEWPLDCTNLTLAAAQELYSGADDCTIVVWASPQLQDAALDVREPDSQPADADAWSDSD